MARELPNEAPQTPEQFQELINIAVENDKERYDAEVAKARARAIEQWDSEEPAKREAIMAHAAANIKAMTVDGSDGPEPLSEAKISELMTQVAQEMNERLAEEKQRVIQQAEGIVEHAKDAEYYESLYGFLKPSSVQFSEQLEESSIGFNPDPYDAIWTDGAQYWDVANACLINPNGRTPIDQSRVVKLGNNGVSSFEQNIRENIKFYSQNDPRIQLGPEIMDTEELLTRLRAERSKRLAEYDQKIAQLDRLIRENPDYATYSIQRAAWDAYATALCNLPSQEGSPWDGGGPETPWPAKPE